MSATNTVRLKFSYQGTDFTRQYDFEGVSNGALDNVKSRVLAFNASLASAVSSEAYTPDNYALMATFVADDFSPVDHKDSTGMVKEISEAKIIVTEETKIPLF